jgi:hypothetical protein
MYYGYGYGYGRGRGMGYGRGMGFGFRGSSPPWPYVGRGRGGLPRCWAYTGYGAPGTAYSPGMAPPAFGPWTMGPPSYGAPYYSREDEIRMLKDQAGMIRDELAAIDARINELEKEKAQGGES